MTVRVPFVRVLAPVCVALAVSLAAVGCASGPAKLPPAGSAEPDKFLFDKGTAAMQAKKWFTAREYLRRLVDQFPQSTYRPDAKLGLGDTYLGENSAESKVLAVNEFREFLAFFPTNARADYAQYKIGVAHSRQMLSAQRDQTETRATIKEFEVFFERYPGSTLRPEAERAYRAARDRLSESEHVAGLLYFHLKWLPGAIDRFKKLLEMDPAYTRRDATYFYLAESLLKAKHPEEALPYFDRLVKEFQKSEYLDRAKKRVVELKAVVKAGGS